MPKFRKKPVVIEAVQWKGFNCDEIDQLGDTSTWEVNAGDGTLMIPTLEGIMAASVGDWVIRGIKDEIYPCKPDIFSATYEPVTE